MTYDYHGQWDKKTGHVAPLYHHEESDNFHFNTNYSINYWLSQGADRKKIILGMPMYGQSFQLSEAKNNGLNAKSYGGGDAGQFTRAKGFLAYYEVKTKKIAYYLYYVLDLVLILSSRIADLFQNSPR